MKALLSIAVVLVVLLFLIPHVLYFFIWLAGKIFAFKVAYKPFLVSSLILVLLCAVIMVYGFFVGRTKYEVKKVDLNFADLPAAFDGYRIVQISDLHLGYMHDCKDFLSAAMDEVNAQNPDIICFTGDLVSHGHKEIDGLEPIITKLKSKDGIFSVMGNHDYSPYTLMNDSMRQAEIAALVSCERNELGWKLLMNENVIIRRGNDSIAVAGVENQSYSFSRQLRFGDLGKALDGTNGMFTVLLSHDPTFWKAEVLPQSKVQLTLSGHTHAAQIKIGDFTPASWVFDETDGLYAENGRYLYVNIGLGCVVPIRVGATPEITVIELHRD